MIPPSTNKMKDVKGRWRSYSLFFEKRQEGYEYFWTLSDTPRNIDGVEIPSLKALYLEYNHVPGFEYQFATEVIGSWVHWQVLLDSGLAHVFRAWREELDVKIKANAMREIINTSIAAEGASRLQAAKYLADKGYAPIRGRPSKAEKEGRLKEEGRMNSEIEDDLERVGLKSVKN